MASVSSRLRPLSNAPAVETKYMIQSRQGLWTGAERAGGIPDPETRPHGDEGACGRWGSEMVTCSCGSACGALETQRTEGFDLSGFLRISLGVTVLFFLTGLSRLVFAESRERRAWATRVQLA